MTPRRVVSGVLATAVIIITLASSPVVHAQDALPEAQAQRLFDEGRALMEQNRYAEACAKFSASERVVPSGGTLLNLADCYEKAGKTASAWARFKEVASRAAAAKRADLETHARDRAAALVPRLSTLTVIVPPESDAPNLTVRYGLGEKMDHGGGEPVDRAAWGTALPLDPATYTVEASAPGRRAWMTKVTISPEAKRETVTVPKLEREPSSSAALTTPNPKAGGDGGSSWSTQKTIAVGVFAGGLIGVGLGSFFGLRAMSKNDDAKTHCPDSPRCNDTDGPALTSDAQSAATVSTIAFAAGGVLVVGGAVLWLTAPSSGVTVSADARGIHAGGTF